MAQLVLTLDPDAARRRDFAERAARRLATLPGCEVAWTEVGELAIVWGRGAAAPHSLHRTEDECGLLLGHAIDDAGRWLDARAVARRWFDPASRDEAFDGYHVAGAYSRNSGLVMGVDPLGLFPLYHTECGGVLLAGTSAELFAAHPLFVSDVDFAGLAGIFLTNGLLSSRTLLRGVQRLGVGCQLRWTPRRGAHEVATWRFTPHDRYHGQSAEASRECVDAELRRAIRRHQPAPARSLLMLSGGLDSRLMAGYLCAEGITDQAVCLGRTTDLEIRAAREVARALGMRFHPEPREPDAAQFVELARRTARWEHLSLGFSGVAMEATGQDLARLAPLSWSGYALEDIVGGVASQFSWDAAAGRWCYDAFFRVSNSWGLPARTLEKLLRTPDAERLIRQQLNAMRREYERPEESPAQRAFRMKLATRTRFNIGAVLHRLCPNSWPLLPMLDRRFLDLHFNLPPEVLQHRRLEQDLLRTRFPRLAAIPLDRNSFLFEPLQFPGRLRVPFVRKAAGSVRKRLRHWYWRHWRKEEPRRYHRCYDLDGPWWRAVRAEAEPHRERVSEWLQRDTLDRLLPGPQVKLGLRDPFAEAGARRILLGLLLWAGTREDGIRI